MYEKMKQKLWLSVICILVFIFPVSARASTIYTNGYFKYTVEDHSVTIVKYTGLEDEVTVPNMIAGNPVNVIGRNSFSKNRDVTTIRLPDTIMSVEEGAFGEKQEVIYAVTDDSSGQSAGGQEDEADTKPTDLGQWIGVPGIVTDDNSLLTVDDENNLVLVDSNGNETVINDSLDYSIKTDTSGNSVIEDASGNTVSASDKGTIEYVDSNDNKVIVDTKTGSKTVETVDGSYEVEEVGIDEEQPKAVASGNEGSTRKESKDNDPEAGVSVNNKDTDSPYADNVNDETTNTESSNTVTKPGTDDFPMATLVVVGVLIVAGAVTVVVFNKRKG